MEEERANGTPADHAPGAPSGTAERVDARAVVFTCITLLASTAWQAMGLVPDPVTKKIERRLEEAHLAIDAAAALADLIRPSAQESERRELDTLLRNLRLNFVEQRAKG